MSLANKVASAQTFEGGVFLAIGEYEATVQNILYRATTTNSGECVILEMTIDKSTNPLHPEGVKRSTVFQLSKTWGLSGLKSALYAIMGANTPEQRAAADGAMGKILAEIEAGKSTPLNGRKVRVTVAPHVTRDKRETTKTLFSAVA